MPNALQIRHYHLYVLKLEEDKFYIGVTSKSPQQRFQEHKYGASRAHWTAKYKPIAIHETEDLGEVSYREATFRENKKVREYMRQHGINSVRGGDLTTIGNFGVLFGNVYDEPLLQSLLLCVFVLFALGLAIVAIVLH